MGSGQWPVHTQPCRPGTVVVWVLGGWPSCRWPAAEAQCPAPWRSEVAGRPTGSRTPGQSSERHYVIACHLLFWVFLPAPSGKWLALHSLAPAALSLGCGPGLSVAEQVRAGMRSLTLAVPLPCPHRQRAWVCVC